MVAETSSCERNTDRARVYGALARLFLPPDPDRVEKLCTRDLPELGRALPRLGADPEVLAAVRELAARLRETDAGALGEGYELTFGASGGLRCPPNETSIVADTPAEQLTKTYQLADLAGFYRAFGVEVSPGSEQPDHVVVELEFLHLLALKEAIALEESGEGEHAAVCRDATRAFLRDHLGRWARRFAERLEEAAAEPVYATAGRLLAGFVGLEMRGLVAGESGRGCGDGT